MLIASATSVANPEQAMLNPLKLKGAVSDRNQAVRGVKIRGDITFAVELIPVMHPWTIPCSKGPTFFDTMLRIHGVAKMLNITKLAAR
uniref:Uncharacterized protein n=1 Tax=Arundo donax TaxID=35708 RepID=A0A0A9FE10_ARUDO